jgi:cell division protein FtsL
VGAAARKIAQTATPSRPVLKVVRGGSSTRTRAQSSAAADGVFRVLAVCMIILAVAGVVRVSLAARAAEATIDAWNIRSEVKAAEQSIKALEADRSALASPSRIEAVACETLNMTKPAQVCYLEYPATGDPDAPPQEGAGPVQVADAASTPTSKAGGLLRTMMDLAASEAQVLLVGDMGLGSVR